LHIGLWHLLPEADETRVEFVEDAADLHGLARSLAHAKPCLGCTATSLAHLRCRPSETHAKMVHAF